MIEPLGGRVRAERLRHGLTLVELAELSGVSRSMLSEVERGTRTPTVPVLERIATGLGTSIARLLQAEQSSRQIVLRHTEQTVARDPAGWERRILSPVLPGVEFEFMHATIPGGVDAGLYGPHAAGSREYLVVQTGTLLLTLDDDPIELRAGDSIYYAGDMRHAFSNPWRKTCSYYLAMDIGEAHEVMQ